VDCFLHSEEVAEYQPETGYPKIGYCAGLQCAQDARLDNPAAMTRHDMRKAIPTHPSRSKSLRILCAEDNEQLAFMVKLAFEKAGHSVECLGDGATALERLTSDANSFDVLMTDHRMPRLTGLGLVSKLRDTEFSGTIIVHSSHLTEAETDAYRALAVDYVLTKPVSLPTLLDLISQIETQV
jgi:CheY-like chemotaxis protein